MKGMLAGFIREIYHKDPPEVNEFHGDWGSLAVSRNIYRGFEPLETESHLFVVICGPVLNFRDNRFLTGDDPVAGTTAIFERYWREEIRWDDDLSGPFAVLIVDKADCKIQWITDLMLFIPVYEYVGEKTLAIGTHVDALAKTADLQHDIDKVSLVDFVLNKVVTYPHTTYSRIRQCHPAAVQTCRPNMNPIPKPERVVYWTPKETANYKNMDATAEALRNAVSSYIGRVTESMDHIALFLSGGEDSRTVAAMLPDCLKKDGFIFLDSMNREGHLARKAAVIHGVNLTVKLRKTTHYLDILPEASDLIGSGRQSLHAHTLGFHKECGFDKYDAIFGGYLGETLLRAFDARKKLNLNLKKFPFLPEKILKGETHSEPLSSSLFSGKVLGDIDRRRKMFLDMVREYRSDSVHEWFQLWPRTMGYSNPNIDVNRRLFRSYEPYTSSEVVKLAASVPATWKINRKLFHKAFRKYHKPSKWIPHSSGYYPYFPWWFNTPFQFLYWFLKKTRRRLTKKGNFEGPWNDWVSLKKTDTWNAMVADCMSEDFLQSLPAVQDPANRDEIGKEELRNNRMVNLFQARYFLRKREFYSHEA